MSVALASLTTEQTNIVIENPNTLKRLPLYRKYKIA